MPHDEEVEFALSCPSTNYLFPGNANYAQDIRSPLANMVANKCPTKKGSGIVRKLYASDFQSSNGAHLELVKNMGITIINLPDGRVQLLHTLANVSSIFVLYDFKKMDGCVYLHSLPHDFLKLL